MCNQEATFAASLERRQSETPTPNPPDRARLIEWFRYWCHPIRSWIGTNQRVPSGEVDDLTQEVFLRLLRYCDEALVEDPQGYLFRVATNVVNNWRQGCRVRLSHDEAWLEELQIEDAEEPENAVARTRMNQYLRAVIGRLPRRQREILLLHVDEEMTYKQIAQSQGLTYRTVLRDLTRAYSSLRQQCIKEDL
ncbi:RNA polymerase sigma factor [Steroidobacter flavus]|uniref:RNA polymerase sigma factor n=1 Tax=Steroidobacter flavus TaxID=1842136 RepID=A0ABV8SZ21_9GAMM